MGVKDSIYIIISTNRGSADHMALPLFYNVGKDLNVVLDKY